MKSLSKDNCEKLLSIKTDCTIEYVNFSSIKWSTYQNYIDYNFINQFTEKKNQSIICIKYKDEKGGDIQFGVTGTYNEIQDNNIEDTVKREILEETGLYMSNNSILQKYKKGRFTICYVDGNLMKPACNLKKPTKKDLKDLKKYDNKKSKIHVHIIGNTNLLLEKLLNTSRNGGMNLLETDDISAIVLLPLDKIINLIKKGKLKDYKNNRGKVIQNKKVCRFFQKGSCTKGTKCHYLHT